MTCNFKTAISYSAKKKGPSKPKKMWVKICPGLCYIDFLEWLEEKKDFKVFEVNLFHKNGSLSMKLSTFYIYLLKERLNIRKLKTFSKTKGKPPTLIEISR